VERLEDPMNSIIVSVFINKILAYSAKKNKANKPPENSTLNPETNSDSPSVKSKGARLVSASVEINHIKKIGHKGNKSQIFSCKLMNNLRSKPPDKIESKIIISPRVTS